MCICLSLSIIYIYIYTYVYIDKCICEGRDAVNGELAVGERAVHLGRFAGHALVIQAQSLPNLSVRANVEGLAHLQ